MEYDKVVDNPKMIGENGAYVYGKYYGKKLEIGYLTHEDALEHLLQRDEIAEGKAVYFLRFYNENKSPVDYTEKNRGFNDSAYVILPKEDIGQEDMVELRIHSCNKYV